MKKILIFGTGFIASNLVKYFQSKKKQCECVILFNKHKIKTCLELKQYSMNGNIVNLFKVEEPDYVIVLYGDSFVSDNANINESINNNVLRAGGFLETIYKKQLHKKIKKIIIVGSASEYGKFYNKPIKEDFNLHPTSMYGLSKIFLFNTFKYFVDRGLPIVYVRQFNTIGIGQRDSFVLPSFIKNIVLIEKNKCERVLSVGDLSQERDFIDIKDVCYAYDLLMEKGIIGDIYNVASGEYISIQMLLNQIIEQSSLSLKDIRIDSNPNLFSKEESLSKRLHADIQKIRNLGFKIKYPLEKTIKEALEFWRKNV